MSHYLHLSHQQAFSSKFGQQARPFWGDLRVQGFDFLENQVRSDSKYTLRCFVFCFLCFFWGGEYLKIPKGPTLPLPPFSNPHRVLEIFEEGWIPGSALDSFLIVRPVQRAAERRTGAKSGRLLGSARRTQTSC